MKLFRRRIEERGRVGDEIRRTWWGERDRVDEVRDRATEASGRDRAD
jgi:hypothetical protein